MVYFYRVQATKELPRRAAVLPSLKAQPGSRSSAPRSHYRPGQAAWPRPQGPLTGQALNPGCFFRGSFQSPHDPQVLSVLHCQWLLSAFVSFATPGTELVPMAIIGPFRASPRLGTEQVPQGSHHHHRVPCYLFWSARPLSCL